MVYWALEPECQILVFMRSFRPLDKNGSRGMVDEKPTPCVSLMAAASGTVRSAQIHWYEANAGGLEKKLYEPKHLPSSFLRYL